MQQSWILAAALASFLCCAGGMRAAAQGGASGPRPGDRRAVKNGTDPGAQRIPERPKKTTVEKLLSQPRPPELDVVSEADPEFEQKRLGPVENTIWTVEADLVSHQLMPDGDFRVVLRGETGRMLVMELPDPKRVDPKSRWAREIAAVRKQFEDRFHPTVEAAAAKGRIRVSALGFWGRKNPRGAPDNTGGVQLHPAVQLDWLPEGSTKGTPAGASK